MKYLLFYFMKKKKTKIKNFLRIEKSLHIDSEKEL